MGHWPKEIEKVLYSTEETVNRYVFEYSKAGWLISEDCGKMVNIIFRCENLHWFKFL